MSAEEREAKKREFFAKPEVKEMSAGLEEIAQAVAVALEDKAVRERIYAKGSIWRLSLFLGVFSDIIDDILPSAIQ